MASIGINVHLQHAEDAKEVSVDDFTDRELPFVTLDLGAVSVFLHDPAVLDAIEEAITEARYLLAQVAEKAAS